MTKDEFKANVVFTANGHFRLANRYIISASSINTDPVIVRQTVTTKSGKPKNEYFVADKYYTLQELLRINFKVIDL